MVFVFPFNSYFFFVGLGNSFSETTSTICSISKSIFLTLIFNYLSTKPLLNYTKFNTLPNINFPYNSTLFVAHDLSYDQAISSIFQVFKEYDSSINLYHFILAASEKYHQLPFHNIFHILDTIQFISFCFKNISFLNNNLKFAILIGALCHDIDHDGYEASYYLNTKNPFSLCFANDSIVERKHIAISLKLIEEFLTVDSKIWVIFSSIILSTDLLKHNQYMESFTKLELFNPEKEEDLILFSCL
jgi:hypothetical protein